MMKFDKFLLVLAIAGMTFATACGGSGSNSSTSTGSTGGSTSSGGGTTPTNNVASLIVDAGPASLSASGVQDEDLAFTTVTICLPGTTTCQTIDHVQVDTGSEGLRLVSKTTDNTAEFSLSLPPQTSGGNPVSECTQFADMSFIWGPIAAADIQVAGETAKNVPIQLASSTVPPASCSPNQTGQIKAVTDLGANAILGVGLFRQDCGGGCALPLGTGSNPGIYYSCAGTTCNQIVEPVLSQVQNPVWMFATDNNGVIVELFSVPSNGAATATGSLIFGIGTQSNNTVGSAIALPPDPNTGNFAVNFQGTVYNDVNGQGPGGTGGAGFIDSGSNGFFFLDSATLSNPPPFSATNPNSGFGIPMPDCPNGSIAQGFYCPGGLTPISASALGESSSGTPVGASHTINFNVQNAVTLFQTGGSVFNDVAGPSSNTFDFGLPFFLGQNVFFAIEGQSTPLGTGPLYAF